MIQIDSTKFYMCIQNAHMNPVNGNINFTEGKLYKGGQEQSMVDDFGYPISWRDAVVNNYFRNYFREATEDEIQKSLDTHPYQFNVGDIVFVDNSPNLYTIIERFHDWELSTLHTDNKKVANLYVVSDYTCTVPGTIKIHESYLRKWNFRNDAKPGSIVKLRHFVYFIKDVIRETVSFHASLNTINGDVTINISTQFDRDSLKDSIPASREEINAMREKLETAGYGYDAINNTLYKNEHTDNTVVNYPVDMDPECINLCNTLNSLPTVMTVESCCGHYKERFNIWFHCDSIPVLSRLGRCVERNYSDGKWELLVDSCDTSPYGLFWLRSKEKFNNQGEMNTSVNNLIQSINHWFKDEFDDYFRKKY